MDIHGDIMASSHLRERALWEWVGGILSFVSALQIVAEEVSGTNDYVQLTFRAHKLDNKVGNPESRCPSLPLGSLAPLLGTNPRSQLCSLLGVSHLPLRPHQAHGRFPPCPQDLFSKSDPFMEIYKTNGDQSDQLVWRTEVGAWGWGEGGRKGRAGETRSGVTSSLCLFKVVKNNLNPSWEPFRLSLHSLCSCDVHRPLKVRPLQTRVARWSIRPLPETVPPPPPPSVASPSLSPM